MSKIDDFINDFNEGNVEIVDYFGGYDAFFDYIESKGRLGDISPKDSNEGNRILYYLSQNNIEKLKYWCNEFLNDIRFEEDKVFFIGDSEDLSTLFCHNARDFSIDTVKSILSGEVDLNWYDNEFVDVFDNIIEDLNETNIDILCNRILEMLKTNKIRTDSDLLETIAAEQGHEEYLILTSENIKRIIKDKDSIKFILDEYCDDLRSELVWLYSDAERSSLEDQYIETVWGELDDEFVSETREWEQQTLTRYDGSKKTYYHLKVQIRDFFGVMNDFLESNAKYQGNELEYEGNFINILEKTMSCLHPRWPDYADWNDIKKYMNENFTDRI